MSLKNIPEMAKNQGRLGRLTPEERSEYSKKGWETKKARKALEDKLKDKQGMLNEAVTAVMAEDPEVLAKIMSNIAHKAMDPDDKAALTAADIFLKHSGITAPKQQEVVVEDVRNIDDTVSELESLGVDIKGLKLINGGK